MKPLVQGTIVEKKHLDELNLLADKTNGCESNTKGGKQVLSGQ